MCGDWFCACCCWGCFGDVAKMIGDELCLSDVVESFANAVSASGKFGGVAGVFVGVHI